MSRRDTSWKVHGSSSYGLHVETNESGKVFHGPVLTRFGIVMVDSFSPADTSRYTGHRSFMMVVNGRQHVRYEPGEQLRTVRQGTLLAGRFAADVKRART